MRLAAAALLAALAAATPAAAGFTAQNGLLVEPAGGGRFAVPWRGLSGPADFWCAAGDYAIRVLHLAPTDRIYRASEPPRRAGEEVVFSVRPEDSAGSTGLLLLWGKGGGLSVGSAQALCEFRRHRR